MKRITILLLLLSFYTSMAQKPISKDNLKGYLKKTFKKSVSTKVDSIGYYCDATIYFVQGYNADGDLNERQIIHEKNGIFKLSNRFFYWCNNLALVQYKHENLTTESRIDLKNLLIEYDEGGKFIVTDVAAIKRQEKAIENEEHIGAMGQEYVSFQEYVNETKCKDL